MAHLHEEVVTDLEESKSQLVGMTAIVSVAGNELKLKLGSHVVR